MTVVDPNQHDSFVLRQRFAPVVNRYEFSLAEGEDPFCFVEQKRFTFKEDIRFFTDSVEVGRAAADQGAVSGSDPRGPCHMTA